ncbi:MFS transporter [Nonomuraea sp. FMUSA5-5]|uniref:MFS transporter n=1 Tax=Nonomuraea composti TaxID=2720023 RepID=A0ABX1BG01_9ACTN|nr:MFS transporter [Nonomuraea sp. FMUSA5-5]NJP96670.1 MFS transporter [Nonomuraea sp. FMUSA5-5]
MTLLVVFVVVCLNLRVAFTGIGPLIPVMGLGQVTATVLTTIPPLCMGLFAPLGALTRTRVGEERGLFIATIVLTAGIVVRSLGMVGLFAGTVVASAAIAVLNVLTPVLVRKRFAPRRVGVMMGLYALLMGASAALTAAVTVPLYQATGSWQITLGAALVPAVLGLAVLPTQLRVPPTRRSATAYVSWAGLLRNTTAWAVTGFFSIQTLLFYTLVAWLPAIMVDAGAGPASAGTAIAFCLVGVAAGGFLGPAWAGRRESQQLPILATIALCLVGLGGIMFAPVSSAAGWAIVLGIGLGAGQGIPGVLYVRRAANQHQTAQLSSMAQGVGFLVAATGPVLAAALHGASGTWTVPLVALAILLIVNAALSPRAGSGTASA